MKGSQEPRIRVEPEWIHSDGYDAAVLMSEYGYTLDQWQQDVVNCWLGKNAEGKYQVTSAGLAVPRQNGKNVCLEAREFFGMVISGEKMLHTAHQVRTAKQSFRRLAAMFTDRQHPEIMDCVKQIRYTNGEESIELINGASILFSARSRQAIRGFDGISLVVYDEAQELTDDQVEAIMATLAASATGTRQLIYTGTPPYPGCVGDVFRRRRSACLTDPGKHDAWFEWSVAGDSIDAIDVNNKDVWYMTNPALGIHLTEEFTEEELRTMSKDGFARERLGWWSPVLSNHVDTAIDPAAWEACKSNQMKPEGKTAYGVRFSADGTEVTLCGAVCPKDAPARISLIARKPTSQGTLWLADWLNERVEKASCVVIDGRNGVDLLCERIHGIWRFKDSVIRGTPKIVIAAASQIISEVNEGTVTWYAFQEDLEDSAISSVKRKIGGGFGFGGDNPTPIEAAALALWGARNSKRDPLKKMRIG